MAGQTILDKPEVKLSDDHVFGSYSTAVAKKGGFDATENARLNEIGIHTADPIVEKKIWSPKFNEYEKNMRWGESYHGRLAMRSVSRFVVGSAAYALAQIYAGRVFGAPRDKEGNKIEGAKGYSGGRPEKNILRRDKKGNRWDLNPLKWVAYGIDETAGRVIKGGTYLVARGLGEREDGARRAAWRSTQFRRQQEYNADPNEDNPGRSLGTEMIATTFDFGAMSFADYMTRYFISIFDPHSKSKWAHKKGHLNLGGGLKELGKNVFSGVTYAAGQDAFAALPYVYFMRGQRNILNKLSPGFRVDNEEQIWGGSLKVKQVGNKNTAPLKKGDTLDLNDRSGRITGDFTIKHQNPEDPTSPLVYVIGEKGATYVGGEDVSKNLYKVVGNYNLEGILDFTGRFTFYNIMTKFYRDLYVNVGERIYNFRHGLKPKTTTAGELGIEGVNQPKTVSGRAKSFLRYVGVTIAKVSFYMIPSSFAFGVLRTAQGRHRAINVSEERQPLDYTAEVPKTGGLQGETESMDIQENVSGKRVRRTNVIGALPQPTSADPTAVNAARMEAESNLRDAYRDGAKPPVHDKFLAPVARVSNRMANAYTGTYMKFTDRFKEMTNIDLQHRTPTRFAERWAEGAVAYTPYIMLSADLSSQYYDTNRSNFVLGGLFGSVAQAGQSLFSFSGPKIRSNFKNLANWTNEAWLAVLKQPSPRFESHIQKVMNDVGYKASNEAFQLYQGLYEKRYEQQEARELAQEKSAEELEKVEHEGINNQWLESVVNDKHRGKGFAAALSPKGKGTPRPSLMERIAGTPSSEPINIR